MPCSLVTRSQSTSRPFCSLKPEKARQQTLSTVSDLKGSWDERT